MLAAPLVRGSRTRTERRHAVGNDVQQSIHNAGAPCSAGTSQVLHTMVVLAMYDAVIAVEGGYEPYAIRIEEATKADVRAAAATAAYLTARARVAASQVPFLDQQYAAYLLTIADGPAKTGGIHVGEQAAAAMLTLRATDGFSNIVLYELQLGSSTGWRV